MDNKNYNHNDDLKDNEKETGEISYIALGTAFGVIFGVILNNIGLGLALGVAAGAVLETINHKK